MDNELSAVDTEAAPCAGLASPGTILLSTNHPITSLLVSRLVPDLRLQSIDFQDLRICQASSTSRHGGRLL